MIGNHRRHAPDARHAPWLFAGVAGVAFLVLHLPYLPASLEDLDSINFALGLHAFDLARHQPHPPGYPLFIAIAKGVRPFVGSDAHALALVGIAAGALGALAIASLFARLGGGPIGVALAVAAPLYWFTAGRPLSDMAGLAAALAVQALILRATSARALAAAAFCAGLAVGLRSQVFWLTAPLLAVSALGRGAAREDGRWPDGRGPAARALAAYLAGTLVWAVPLVLLSGGPRAYWRAVSEQGAEDLSGIRMLWTTPTPLEFRDALYYAFVSPWATWPLAAVVLALAVLGAIALVRRDRARLALLAVAFGPYLLFDLLFQETFTSRYALPLVVPVACLAARGAATMPAYGGVAAAVAAAAFGAHVGGTSLAAYARQPAPAFRLLADWQRTPMSPLPVVAMDRREALDLRGPVKYIGGLRGIDAQLPSPPQHEWLEVVKYWEGGGRSPVWFVADPKRTDIDLVQHGEPYAYRWSLPYPVLIDGVRPGDMDWHQLDAPEWWLGEGWALTPELAGMAEASRRGPAYGPIEGRLSPAVLGGLLVIGGRNFDAARRPRVEVVVDGTRIDAFDAPAGAFVRAARLPPAAAAGRAATVRVSATPPAAVAIEQFDASASRALMAYGEGWHEQELAPSTGRRWRWTSDRAELRIASPRPAGALVLRLAGESPLKYFSRPSTLTVRADGVAVFSASIGADFSLIVPIPRPAAIVSVETDQTYVPAERSFRTRDRRRLGLRIFTCEIRGVFAPGR